jgi:hypothetical protein
MAVPTNKKEFGEWCLRKLGAPVIEINVSEEQVSDRIDEALKYYMDYHYDGSHKTYLKHQITQADIDNKWIPIAEEVIGIVRIFPLSTIMSTGFFSATYQLAMDAIGNLGGFNIEGYYEQRQRLNVMEEVLVGNVPIRFNRHMNKLFIDVDWSKQTIGDYIVAEAYAYTDPGTYTDVWKDKWLQRYATELIREQWGHNLTKFVNMQLPGGIQFNGEAILSEARENLKDLENEMISSYSIPVADFIG